MAELKPRKVGLKGMVYYSSQIKEIIDRHEKAREERGDKDQTRSETDKILVLKEGKVFIEKQPGDNRTGIEFMRDLFTGWTLDLHKVKLITNWTKEEADKENNYGPLEQIEI